MILIAKKHKTWIEIVTSFGCPAETSEDIVQEMYIKIHKKLNKGLDIMYKDEVNYYYIFKTLRTLFFDHTKTYYLIRFLLLRMLYHNQYLK